MLVFKCRRKQNVYLLVPTDVLDGYASGSYLLHTVGTSVSVAEVRNHLQRIASQVEQKAFELRLYPKRESLYFTVYDQSMVYAALGPNPATGLWGLSSNEQGVIKLFHEQFEGMWSTSISDVVPKLLRALAELAK